MSSMRFMAVVKQQFSCPSLPAFSHRSLGIGDHSICHVMQGRVLSKQGLTSLTSYDFEETSSSLHPLVRMTSGNESVTS